MASHLLKAPRYGQTNSLIGKSIRNNILNEVKCSVMADEVTDSSNKEVLSIVLKYVKKIL